MEAVFYTKLLELLTNVTDIVVEANYQKIVRFFQFQATFHVKLLIYIEKRR